MQAGIPIVPLSLVGSRHVMRKGELTTRPGDVVLVVHDPVPTAGIAEPSPDVMRELAARIRAIIAPAPDAEADGGETALRPTNLGRLASCSAPALRRVFSCPYGAGVRPRAGGRAS